MMRALAPAIVAWLVVHAAGPRLSAREQPNPNTAPAPAIVASFMLQAAGLSTSARPQVNPTAGARPALPNRSTVAHAAGTHRARSSTSTTAHATPSRQAIPTREAAPSRQAIPAREATPTREATPARQAIPTREATPSPQAIPARDATSLGQATQPGPSSTQTSNPTVLENQKAGSADWEITNPALDREIEGYASHTSVNRGEAIDIFVSTREPRFTVDVFRTGWYGGTGARRYHGPIEREGTLQEMPVQDASTGLLECRWRDPVRLETSDGRDPWPSGVYLARLTTVPRQLPGGAPERPSTQSFVVFVVRDDARDASLLFQSSVTTFAAYNNWGGRSLYAFNSGNNPARKVSFDRPYATNPYGVRLDGAGDYLRRWEYNAVRFLEREGYDVTYVTDVDTHARPDLVAKYRIFLSVGHDEYWSNPKRQQVEAARDRGVHLVFLGSDVCYWQTRFEPSSDNRPDRTLVAYKEAADTDDPLANDANPRNNRLITGRWRDKPISRPEERFVGVMYAADPVDGDIIVDNASHWVFAGTGLKRGDALPGLLGYEVDMMYGEGPSTIERLAHSPYGDRGRGRYADMTIYTAASGALVFATGTMQWNWGLDGYNAPAWHPLRVNPAAQRITRTVLDRMLQYPGTPVTPPSSRPSLIVMVALVIAVLAVVRAWRARPAARRDKV